MLTNREMSGTKEKGAVVLYRVHNDENKHLKIKTY